MENKICHILEKLIALECIYSEVHFLFQTSEIIFIFLYFHVGVEIEYEHYIISTISVQAQYTYMTYFMTADQSNE